MILRLYSSSLAPLCPFLLFTQPQPQKTTATILVSSHSSLLHFQQFFMFFVFILFIYLVFLFYVFVWFSCVGGSGWFRWKNRRRKSWSNCTKPRGKRRMHPAPPIVRTKKADALMRSSSSRNFPSIIKFSLIPRLLFLFAFYDLDYLVFSFFLFNFLFYMFDYWSIKSY